MAARVAHLAGLFWISCSLCRRLFFGENPGVNTHGLALAGDVHLQFRSFPAWVFRLELLRSFLDVVCRGTILLGLAVRRFFLSPIALRRIVITLVVAGPVVRFVSGLCLGAWLETPAQIAKAVHSLPTSHLDAFAFGALLTLLPARLGEWLRSRAMKVFLAMLAVTVIAGLTHAFILQANRLSPGWLALGYGGMADYFQYTWTYTLLNATSAALIFCALQPTILQRWLTWPWLLHIGKISYGLYVFHLPLMHISHSIWPASYHSPQGLTRFASYFLVALALSTLSYRIFEKRFLGLKDSFWGRRMAVATKVSV